MVSPIPEGCHTVTPYMVVPDAIAAMEFYEKALGSKRVMHMPGPGGQGTMHAEMRLGNSTIMLTDENPQWGMKAPATLGGSPVNMMIYVEDCDAVYHQAIAAGCKSTCELEDMFWGDRLGKVEDPFGYQWSIATHKEDVSAEEMATRQAAWLAEMAAYKGGDA